MSTGSIAGISFEMTPEGIAGLQKKLGALYSGIANGTNVAVNGGGGGANSVGGILAQQGNAINNLKYQPIDVAGLTKQAEEQAASNAAKSLALEQQLAPGVAAARSGLQSQVASDLALGGALPADVANEVTRHSGAQAGAAGLLGSQAPATAASLGLTALSLRNQRQDAASRLLAANPAPEAGLSPGSVADLTVANANAGNQFALSKLGALGNFANSQIGAIQSNLERQAGSGGGSVTIGGGNQRFTPFNPTAGTPANGGWLPTNSLYDGVTSLPGSNGGGSGGNSAMDALNNYRYDPFPNGVTGTAANGY